MRIVININDNMIKQMLYYAQQQRQRQPGRGLSYWKAVDVSLREQGEELQGYQRELSKARAYAKREIAILEQSRLN
jgi:hypothetical protein